jgi:probable HAF family extracellular repeat protein
MHASSWILPPTLALAVALPAQATSFQLTDLAAPAGFNPTYSHGTALNDRGDVVGHANSASFPVATTWLAPAAASAQRSGEVSPMPGGRNGITAINNGGVMAGGYDGAYGAVAMFNAGAGWQQAPWPDARYICCGQVDDINDNGVAVGSWYPLGLGSPTRWQRTAQGAWVADTLPGGQGGAVAVNAQGQIAGNTAALGAVLWNADKTLVDIPTLAPTGGQTTAAEINDHGSVVGWGANAANRRQGFIWQAGAMTVLPGLDGWALAPATNTWISQARGINNDGWVVGQALTASGALHGFLWRGGAMVDLNSLVSADDPFFDLPEVATASAFQIIDATAVNNAGQILAVAQFNRLAANGAVQQATHSLLLTPVAAVPEPASWALLLAGSAGLLAWRRRQAAAAGAQSV